MRDATGHRVCFFSSTGVCGELLLGFAFDFSIETDTESFYSRAVVGKTFGCRMA
ncbi:MAG: hypothetical protein HW380_2414 [Magnetococcales bacterium]|nr:hypothetical protein [Magnetococcales bacterium]